MNGLPELRDIHPAPPPDFWPPAPGWWLLTGSVLLVLALVGWLCYQKYRRWRRRRAVLKELAALQRRLVEDGDAPAFVADLSVLLRRIALARFPLPQVAGLNGADWLHFLDDTGGKGRFSNGPGQVLALGPYAPHIEVDADGLYALAGDWIRRNL